jgi:protein PsiE
MAENKSERTAMPHMANATEHLHDKARLVGTLLVDVFHYVGLFVIGATTVWAAVGTFVDLIVKKHHASVEDILLLFIFLEIGAMVGIYFKTNHMPVRFLLYVAITAATRHMIGVINHSQQPGMELLVMTGAILMLSFALLCVRYASYSFPSGSVRPPSFETDLDGGAKSTGKPSERKR